MELKVILVMLIVAALLWAALSSRRRRHHTLCPKCGGILDADPHLYRHVVVWTCRECGDTFESLKGRK